MLNTLRKRQLISHRQWLWMLMLGLLTANSIAWAQTATITGTVTDAASGETLAGATVQVKGTNTGATTDAQGKYRISVATTAPTLVFSFIGYQPLEQAAGNRSVVDVKLTSSDNALSEVVVVGYGVQNRRDITTAIGSVKARDIANQPVASFDQALAAKIAGVQVTQTSGAPGAALQVRVRGTGSISAGLDPLYVIDGIPLSRDTKFATGSTSTQFPDNPINVLSTINTDDIESIEVLKDASAAAIYGSRGSNGVVLLTTKRGREGKTIINYDTYVGFQQVTKKLDLLNAYEYAQLNVEGKNTAYLDRNPTGSASDPNSVREKGVGSPSTLIPPQVTPYLSGQSGLTSTDWQDEIFRTAPIQNHTLSIAGGTANVKYYVSGNYLDQRGTVINSGFKRYSARANLDIKSGRLTVGFNFNPTYAHHDLIKAEGPYLADGVIGLAVQMAPVFPVYNANGTYNFDANGWGYGATSILNPVAVANEVSDKLNQIRLLGNAYAQYEITKGLAYRLNVGADINNFQRDYYRPSTVEIRDRKGPSIPTGFSRTQNYVDWLVEHTLNYNRSFGLHNVSGLAGFSAQKDRRTASELTATNYPNDLVQTLNAGQVTSGSSDIQEWSLLSYLGRVQYDYDGRYLVSAAIRADGSSRFGAANRWGYFPSVSAGWNISQEPFLKSSNWLSDLKLRGSYGLTGNFQIPNYGSVSLLNYQNYVLGPETIVSGLAPGNSANDKLKWEKTAMLDIGFDANFFKNRLSLTVDYYNANTSDLLLNVPVPRTSGFSTELQNIGKVNNQGFEFTLGTQQTFGKFGWTASANLATNRNRVRALGASGDPILVSGGVAGAQFITRIGEPVGQYYTMVYDGVFKSQAEVDAYPHTATTKPGDFRFIDTNGDGRIDFSSDRTVTGSYFPKYTFGFTNRFTYSGFDLGVTLQGVQGNKILNLIRRYIYNGEGNGNQFRGALNRWQSEANPGDGLHNRANRLQTGSNGEISTWHIEDGSYVRIRTITLGYSLPTAFMQRLHLTRARVYVSAQNPFTFTKYTGYNPEVSSRPDNALSAGEDYGTYPLARTTSVGINLSF
ncbi:SusC/RagA family TonB-linked outer membrane protein [Spirosoma utsteinense]|uniref:TonB-linked SusC/RagA family outer membrane protein n=1 Tax=Spirosoma utsteinense TaxID=2585773 RepID=A0ABR6WBC3_9BACT|nr:TonB-dependent receptor [Spirosoma utsteinense]MBC3787644.1 TonB-linked SusC/RagA family outer membrane protein [Spirosoma utsteinense]MBC3793240.1 TonB-linked SusC/RagA family outer membrane protein [Spirosoma utsteinense]